jgi:hypothetical protein
MFIIVNQTLSQPDRSCYQDKVNGLPADAHAPMVFATQLRKLNRDKTHPAHLDGKAKTIFALTLTATKPYRRPLGTIRNLTS